jgi:hypothetical protein
MYFCKKTPADFGIDVYRNSIDVPGPGKSAGKGLALLFL